MSDCIYFLYTWYLSRERKKESQEKKQKETVDVMELRDPEQDRSFGLTISGATAYQRPARKGVNKVSKRFDSLRGQRGREKERGGREREKARREESFRLSRITSLANEMRSFRELFGQQRRAVTII